MSIFCYENRRTNNIFRQHNITKTMLYVIYIYYILNNIHTYLLFVYYTLINYYQIIRNNSTFLLQSYT